MAPFRTLFVILILISTFPHITITTSNTSKPNPSMHITFTFKEHPFDTSQTSNTSQTSDTSQTFHTPQTFDTPQTFNTSQTFDILQTLATSQLFANSHNNFQNFLTKIYTNEPLNRQTFIPKVYIPVKHPSKPPNNIKETFRSEMNLTDNDNDHSSYYSPIPLPTSTWISQDQIKDRMARPMAMNWRLGKEIISGLFCSYFHKRFNFDILFRKDALSFIELFIDAIKIAPHCLKLIESQQLCQNPSIFIYLITVFMQLIYPNQKQFKSNQFLTCLKSLLLIFFIFINYNSYFIFFYFLIPSHILV